MFVSVWRDGQSGKLTVDDYGAKTGRSPDKMRQLNINGDLYIGKNKHYFEVDYNDKDDDNDNICSHKIVYEIK